MIVMLRYETNYLKYELEKTADELIGHLNYAVVIQTAAKHELTSALHSVNAAIAILDDQYEYTDNKGE